MDDKPLYSLAEIRLLLQDATSYEIETFCRFFYEDGQDKFYSGGEVTTIAIWAIEASNKNKQHG